MGATPNGFNLDNTGQRIVVDPVCRIEGHMRCEVNVDADGYIRNAVSTGTMWRGLEVILKGRDPRDAWAFTERICGVCTGTHALTSVRAVEDDAMSEDLEEPKPGFLHIQTNWFDRLFISVVIWVALSLFWMRFQEPPGLSVWIAVVLSVALGVHIIRKG